MVAKVFDVALDVKRASDNREFSVVEGDTGNFVHIALTDDGAPVDLTDCRVMAVFSKSNGTSMQDSGVPEGGVTLGGAAHNEITIHLFQSSFSNGVVECEIQVYSGVNFTTLITTAKFNFQCRRGILNDDTIQATNEYPFLVDLIDTVETLEDDVTAAEALRIAAEEGRVAQEAGRVEAETARVTAEAERAQAETERATASTQATQGAVEAAASANTAAASANSAAASANTAATRADTAAAACEGIADGSVGWEFIQNKPEAYPPTAHAAQHAAGGSDPVTPAAIGAAALVHATRHGASGADPVTPAAIGASVKRAFTATIPNTGWTAGAGQYTRAVAVSGILATDEPVVDVVWSATAATRLAQKAAWACVDMIVTGNNTITVYASKIPAAALAIHLLVMR